MRKYRREPRPDTRSFPYSPDARYSGTASLAPRIYEGGGPRSGRGSPPAAAAGKASSVTALPCQLPQRGSRGRYAPFLPPAFMRGEGHAVAGGPPPPQRRGKPPQSRLRRASSPRGEPRALRTVLAPRSYEGEGREAAGRVLPPQRRKPSQSRLRRAGSPKGRARGAAP